jgi:hypothetical protein
MRCNLGTSNHKEIWMNLIECRKCDESFDRDRSLVAAGAAATMGGAAGAYLGTNFGISTAGAGMAAVLPFALVGATFGGLGLINFVKCPHCKAAYWQGNK